MERGRTSELQFKLNRSSFPLPRKEHIKHNDVE
jgi:hypothetical protein